MHEFNYFQDNTLYLYIDTKLLKMKLMMTILVIFCSFSLEKYVYKYQKEGSRGSKVNFKGFCKNVIELAKILLC